MFDTAGDPAENTFIIRNGEKKLMKEERVSMPMGSAGIIGFSSDIKLDGIEIDPKALIIAVFVIVIVVNVTGKLIT